MASLESRILKLEKLTQAHPGRFNWLCVEPFNEALIDNRQVFRSLADIPASYQREQARAKVFVGVCPNDWD